MKKFILSIIYTLTIIYAKDSYPFNIGEKLIYDVSFAELKQEKHSWRFWKIMRIIILMKFI